MVVSTGGRNHFPPQGSPGWSEVLKEPREPWSVVQIGKGQFRRYGMVTPVHLTLELYEARQNLDGEPRVDPEPAAEVMSNDWLGDV